MLPSLRTVLAAIFVTATLVTLVGTALMPVFPRVEQPRARLARTENPNDRSHLLGYARFPDEQNRPRAAEPSGSTSEANDGKTSTYAKTLVTAREGLAASGAHGAVSALATDDAAVNSNTRSVNVARTGSVNPSIASGEESTPLRGSAASLARPPKRSVDRCVFCHQGLHAHSIRHRGGRWHRVRMTLDRNSAF